MVNFKSAIKNNSLSTQQKINSLFKNNIEREGSASKNQILRQDGKHIYHNSFKKYYCVVCPNQKLFDIQLTTGDQSKKINSKKGLFMWVNDYSKSWIKQSKPTTLSEIINFITGSNGYDLHKKYLIFISSCTKFCHLGVDIQKTNLRSSTGLNKQLIEQKDNSDLCTKCVIGRPRLSEFDFDGIEKIGETKLCKIFENNVLLNLKNLELNTCKKLKEQGLCVGSIINIELGLVIIGYEGNMVKLGINWKLTHDGRRNYKNSDKKVLILAGMDMNLNNLGQYGQPGKTGNRGYLSVNIPLETFIEKLIPLHIKNKRESEERVVQLERVDRQFDDDIEKIIRSYQLNK
jgi:hypothetical protein